VRLLLAEAPHAPHPLSGHKTTDRPWQDAALHDCETEGAFDMLFFDAEGALLEGARSNVFVRLDGCWFTPPLAAGILPGVMRAALLDDPAWAASERRLTRDDLERAEEIVVCNALRGAMRAVVVARHSAAA
jgi:para-aminobenzoate synthetase/4-amino-4-deoxychorismate lyase